MFGAVGARAVRHSILQHSGLMRESRRVFFAFHADIEADLRLVMCPIHRLPVTFLAELGEYDA